MKKLLLASTALVVTAGAAAAQEITFSTDGYMGIAYGDDAFVDRFDNDDPDTANADEGSTDLQYIFDLDFAATASTQTDSGLVFGATVDFDEMDTSQQAGDGLGAPGYDGSIFVSGDYGTLSMGDVDGAAEAIVGDLYGVGLSGLGVFNENAFVSGLDIDGAGGGGLRINPALDDAGIPVDENDDGIIDFEVEELNDDGLIRPIALYEYSFGPADFAASSTDDGVFSAAVGYSGDTFGAGIGYERTPDIDGNGGESIEHIIGYGEVTLASIDVKATYGNIQFNQDDDVGDINQYGVSAASTFDATTVSAYWRRLETEGLGDGGDDLEEQIYGLGAEYDLGGGLYLAAGVIGIDDEDDEDGYDAAADEVAADFGIGFAF